MNSYIRVYVHFVWATWDRQPTITAERQETLYRCIAERCRHLKGQPIEIGGVEDHVHVIVRMPSTVTIADMVKEMKGASSHLINTVHPGADLFRWQGSYAAISVSVSDLDKTREYVRRQKQHHEAKTLDPHYEGAGDDPDSE
jgi:putative transposase